MQRTAVSTVRRNMFATAAAEPNAILRELFELLEDYSPMWYTEELHNRAAAALGERELEPAF